MKLDVPLLKLPRQYCAETLAAEVLALPQSAWIAHPGKLPGNDAVPLITPGGAITNGFAGPMEPTEHLRRCPYIMEIMADLGAVWGRSRLMGLAASADVPNHVDVGYYWRTHLRLHIPVITNPGVEFTCDDRTVHMKAGECWAFDSFCLHNVRNSGNDKRIHLVLDTVGGEKLWDLMVETRHSAQQELPAKFVPPGTTPITDLAFERINTPEIMSSWEVRCHIDFLVRQAPDAPELPAVAQALDRFATAWAAAWAQFGPTLEGLPRYHQLIARARDDLKRTGAGRIMLHNAVPFDHSLNALIFMVAVPSPTQTMAA
ncbi:MAG: aspartyl/asparaginyl beta-hydroxylase domain-containing protein [Sphingomonadaceae bacterium]|nr:aspartyl/asparaginyl beta-hydroxylase domain-containing protein [Sphingomonadaceae bacterium]